MLTLLAHSLIFSETDVIAGLTLDSLTYAVIYLSFYFQKTKKNISIIHTTALYLTLARCVFNFLCYLFGSISLFFLSLSSVSSLYFLYKQTAH